jgi:hypothetical protein
MNRANTLVLYLLVFPGDERKTGKSASWIQKVGGISTRRLRVYVEASLSPIPLQLIKAMFLISLLLHVSGKEASR